jgi:hypothetical protein
LVLLISLVMIMPACLFVINWGSSFRPAAQVLIPTATTVIITPTATQFVPPTATPYVAPTDTPPPTAPAPAAADASGITVGGKVKVTGTGSAGGLNMRDQPSTSGALLRKLPEGNVYEVVGGPREADSYVWWQLRDPADGVTGWGAQRFLAPSP